MRYRAMGVTPTDFEMVKDHMIATAFSLGEDEISEECQGEDKHNNHGDSKARDPDSSIMDLFIISKQN